MNPEQIRAAVAQAYHSAQWAHRVRRMNDQQVLAIYFRFKRKGKL